MAPLAGGGCPPLPMCTAPSPNRQLPSPQGHTESYGAAGRAADAPVRAARLCVRAARVRHPRGTHPQARAAPLGGARAARVRRQGALTPPSARPQAAAAVAGRAHQRVAEDEAPAPSLGGRARDGPSRPPSTAACLSPPGATALFSAASPSPTAERACSPGGLPRGTRMEFLLACAKPPPSRPIERILASPRDLGPSSARIFGSRTGQPRGIRTVPS